MKETEDLGAARPGEGDARRLRTIYFVRAAFACFWAIGALFVPPSQTVPAALLLLIYPLWDAAANLLDARGRSGASAVLARINVAISVAAVLGVATVLASRTYSILLVFGVWAVLAGVLQLAVGAKRRRTVAGQWPMMLSGAQSAVIGSAFIVRSATMSGQVSDLAVYALFGAAYFVLSALWLSRSISRSHALGSAATAI